MSYYGNILEEELKNKIALDLFSGFDTTQIIGRVDFCVSIPADPLGLNEAESLFWAYLRVNNPADSNFRQGTPARYHITTCFHRGFRCREDGLSPI